MSYSLKYKKVQFQIEKELVGGNATGQGRTAGKGHKGYKSRSGTKAKFHFEGGQTPLMRRASQKRGMKIFSKVHRYKNTYQIINLEKLSDLKVSKIDHDFLYKNNLIKSKDIPLKVLSKGDLKKSLEISATFLVKQL